MNVGRVVRVALVGALVVVPAVGITAARVQGAPTAGDTYSSEWVAAPSNASSCVSAISSVDQSEVDAYFPGNLPATWSGPQTIAFRCYVKDYSSYTSPLTWGVDVDNYRYSTTGGEVFYDSLGAPSNQVSETVEEFANGSALVEWSWTQTYPYVKYAGLYGVYRTGPVVNVGGTTSQAEANGRAVGWENFAAAFPANNFGEAYTPVPPNPCEAVSFDLAYKLAGETSFTVVADPGGTTLRSGDTVRITAVDGSIDPPTAFAARFAADLPWHVLGGGPSATYPLEFELASVGPQTDFGAIEILCDTLPSDPRYWQYSTGWDDVRAAARACANVAWTWPSDPELIVGESYELVAQWDDYNGGSNLVTGLFLDYDDPGNASMDGRVAVFDPLVATSHGQTLDSLWSASGAAGSEVDLSLGSWNPPNVIGLRAYVPFVFAGPSVTGAVPTSGAGVWCTDDSGDPPILYRMDSTYTGLGDEYYNESPTSGGCFTFTGMSLTNPVSWVSGAGKMGLCLARVAAFEIVMPDPAYLDEWMGDASAFFEGTFPFSMMSRFVTFVQDTTDAVAVTDPCLDVDIDVAGNDTPCADVANDLLTGGNRATVAAIVIGLMMVGLLGFSFSMLRREP